MSKPDLRQPDKFIFINGHIMAKPQYQYELNQKQKEKIQKYNDIMQSQLKNYYGETKNSEDFNNMINDAKTGERTRTFEINKKSAMVILERLYDKLTDKQKGENLMLLYNMIKNESDMKKYDELSDVSRRLNQQSNLLNTDNEIESYIDGILKYMTTGEIERSLYKKNLKFDTNDKISQALNKLSNIQTSGNNNLVKQLEKLASTSSTKKQEQGISLLDDFLNADDINTAIVEEYTKQIQDINDQKTVVSQPQELIKSKSEIAKEEEIMKQLGDIDSNDGDDDGDNLNDSLIYNRDGVDVTYDNLNQDLKQYIKSPDEINDNDEFVYTILKDGKPYKYVIDTDDLDDYSQMRLLDSINKKKLLKSNNENLKQVYNSFNSYYDQNGEILQQVKEDKKKYNNYMKKKNKKEVKDAKEAKEKADKEAKDAKEEARIAEEKRKKAEEERIKVEEEAKDAKEAKQKAEDEAEAVKEAARKAEEERIKAEEEKEEAARKAEEEEKKKAEKKAARKAEKKRKAEEEKEEAARKAEEERIKAEEERIKAEETARKLQEAEEAARKAENYYNSPVDVLTNPKQPNNPFKPIREFFQSNLKSRLTQLNILQQIGKSSQYKYDGKDWTLNNIKMKDMIDFKIALDAALLDKDVSVSNEFKKKPAYKQLVNYVNEIDKTEKLITPQKKTKSKSKSKTKSKKKTPI